jgi:hypothetical protein
MQTKIAVMISICLVAVLSFSLVYAITSVWSTDVSVTVVSLSGTIGVYSDSACTQQVTSIDFGNVQQGGTASKSLWIKNLGTGSIGITWSSTISTSTSMITDNMKYGSPPNDYYWTTTQNLGSGIVFPVVYSIVVNSGCATQVYSWTISINTS